jgi:hypothetical protein
MPIFFFINYKNLEGKMRKLYLLMLVPIFLFAQPKYTGELQIALTNYGYSWDVTFALTAVGARWDENYELTEGYESISDNINSVIYETSAYFDHILNPGSNPEFAMGLYKISAIENGNEQAYFWMDWRTSDNPDLDVNFYYDVGNNNFRDWDDTQIINYSYQTIWDLTPGNLETPGLEDHWDNCLVAIPQKNPSPGGLFEPFIIWGPYNGFQPTGYKIHWRYGETGSFSLLQAVNATTYSFRHENLATGQGLQAYYKVKAYNNLTESDFTNIASIGTSGWYQGYKRSFEVDNLKMLYMLEQNYPNPFNSATTISYSISEKDKVTIKVFDILGREVAELVNEQKEAGTHTIKFDASNLTSGIYFYQIKAGKYSETRKLILQK